MLYKLKEIEKFKGDFQLEKGWTDRPTDRWKEQKKVL